MADMDNAPLDLSRLSDDQRKAFALAQAPAPAEGPSLGERASSFLDRHKEGINTAIKAAEYTSPMGPSLYAANQFTGGNKVDATPPPPPSTGQWPAGPPPAQPGGPVPPPAVAAQMGQPPPPQQVNRPAGAPVDYMKRAADETGNSVSTAPVDVAQGHANQVADLGADLQGTVGQNSAANASRAMTADKIDAAHYATQHEGVEDHIQRLNNRSAAIDEDVANAKIDPDRKWKNKSTGGKILSQLAVGFGALGQAFGQKTNIGLDNLHKSIDDDVDEQKREIESKKGLSANLKGLVGQYHQTGLDLDASQAKAKAAHWDDALKASQIFVDQAKGPEAKQAALAKQADIAKSAAEAKVEAQKQIVRQATLDKERAAQAAAQGAAAQAAAQYKHQQDAMENRRKDIELGLKGEMNNAQIGKMEADAEKAKAAKGEEPVVAAVNKAMPGTGSTALIPGIVSDPRRYLGFTETAKTDRANNAYTSTLHGVAHKLEGLRGYEDQTEALKSLALDPLDSTARIKEKQERFKQIYNGLQTAGVIGDELPKAPEEDQAER